MKISLRLAVLALVALPVFTGCAASASDEDQADESGAAVSASAAVTVANFQGHPKVVEIRKIVADVDAKVGSFVRGQRADLCQGPGESTRTLYSSGGVDRRLVLEGGSDDSFVTTTLTYDTKGTLRFAYSVQNGVHGNRSETRSYFGADGVELITVARSGFAEPPATADLSHAAFTKAEAPADLASAKKPQARFDAAPDCF